MLPLLKDYAMEDEYLNQFPLQQSLEIQNLRNVSWIKNSNKYEEFFDKYSFTAEIRGCCTQRTRD